MALRPVLGLDLDGVCADYSAALRAHVAASRGLDPDRYDLELPEPHHWSLVASGWFRSDAQFRAAHAEAVAAGLFATMTPIAGVSEALSRLSDAGVHIRVITHRLMTGGGHRRAVSDTVTWLDAHRIPYSDLCFVGDKGQVGADLYIDDAPHNIAALRAVGCPTIVFNQPYNQGVAGPRALNWVEAEAMITEALLGSGRRGQA